MRLREPSFLEYTMLWQNMCYIIFLFNSCNNKKNPILKIEHLELEQIHVIPVNLL